MDSLLQEKSARMNIFRQIKRIVHGDFSACSLNTKSFYDGLIKISQSEFCCRGKVLEISSKTQNLIWTQQVRHTNF